MRSIIINNIHEAISKSSILSYAGKDGVIKYVNENFARISGYSKTELLGSDHRILNSGHHPKSFWINAWKTIAKGEVWRDEVLNRGKHGNLYWVDSFIYPFKDEHGKITGYFSIRNDITIRKQHELSLQKKNQLLEEIAWTQSHEMRAPVASILGLINILDYSNTDTKHNTEVIDNLKKVATVLDTKIRSIVRLAEQ